MCKKDTFTKDVAEICTMFQRMLRLSEQDSEDQSINQSSGRVSCWLTSSWQVLPLGPHLSSSVRSTLPPLSCTAGTGLARTVTVCPTTRYPLGAEESTLYTQQASRASRPCHCCNYHPLPYCGSQVVKDPLRLDQPSLPQLQLKLPYPQLPTVLILVDTPFQPIWPPWVHKRGSTFPAVSVQAPSRSLPCCPIAPSKHRSIQRRCPTPRISRHQG